MFLNTTWSCIFHLHHTKTIPKWKHGNNSLVGKKKNIPWWMCVMHSQPAREAPFFKTSFTWTIQKCWSPPHDHLRWNIFCNRNTLICSTWSSKKYWSSCLAVPLYNHKAGREGRKAWQLFVDWLTPAERNRLTTSLPVLWFCAEGWWAVDWKKHTREILLATRP